MNDIYLVRHGNYSYAPRGDDHEQQLTVSGVAEAERAANCLQVVHGLDDTAILMTSVEQRAVQTAKIIGKRLDLQPIQSKYLVDTPLESNVKLGELVSKCLIGVDVQRTNETAVIVVSHQPFINDILANTGGGSAVHGGVYKASADSQFGRPYHDDEPELTDMLVDDSRPSRLRSKLGGVAAASSSLLLYKAWKAKH